MSRYALLARGLWVGALLSLATLAAAQMQISARVDQDIVSRDDTVELTVTVAGSGLSMLTEPTLPALDGFEVMGTSTQQSISLVGGAMQATMNYVYDLHPTRTGKLKIPPVTLSVHGRTVRTQAIAVTVLPGSGRATPSTSPPPLPGGNPFEGLGSGKSADVKHTVDRKTVYVGQQVTYTFSFLQSEQLFGEVQYSPADTPGFVAEELPNPPQSTQNLDGRMYSVQRRMKALFATAPGKHTIGEASVTATMDPMLGPEQLTADPITIQVLPLPQAGQPAHFSGAVGSFTVRLRVDRPVVRAGETVNCVVDVVGTGSVRSLGEPQLNLPDWVRVYKAGENRTVRPGGGGGDPTAIGGTASFSYLLLPRQAGTLRVGPITYNMFDPRARAYRTATSQAVEVTVAPGSGVVAPVVPTDNLRPVKAALGHPVHGPLLARLWLWVVLALPLLAVLWCSWQRWREECVLAAPGQVRAGKALSLAHKRFEMAERSLAAGDTDAFYTEMHAALLDYIADRTTAPPSGLTAEIAQDLLLRHGAEAELAERTRTLVERTAAGRFAPGGMDVAQARDLAAECRQALAALQRQVRPDA